MDELTIYRRKLPHWRRPGAVYFVTWRMHAAQSDLTPAERTAVVEAIRHFDGSRYDLHAFVVMNDHVHVLVQVREPWTLQQVVHSWKSFTANRLQREFARLGALWQEEYFDRIVRDEEEYFEKMNYILTNVVRRWPEIVDYEWCGAMAR